MKFTTVAAMVANLSQALKAGTYPARLRTYLRPSVLILDEIGFLPLEAGQASLLFEVISRRYERGSIILTSNKSYAEWAEIFSGDEVIATAMLDRLLHHATTITIKGQSYRLKDKRAGSSPETRRWAKRTRERGPFYFGREGSIFNRLLTVASDR